MNAYQLAQEWNDLQWGTVMPVTVMIGSELVQMRARGICSVAVSDPLQLEQKIPDPDNLVAFVKSLLAQVITDMLGKLSSDASNVGQLITITAETIQVLRVQLEPKFTAIGLRLKDVSIQVIEKL
jgi:membrane protease subunit (stomatin/prohibitin family)